LVGETKALVGETEAWVGETEALVVDDGMLTNNLKGLSVAAFTDSFVSAIISQRSFCNGLE